MATQEGGRKRTRDDVSRRGEAGEIEAWKRVERERERQRERGVGGI